MNPVYTTDLTPCLAISFRSVNNQGDRMYVQLIISLVFSAKERCVSHIYSMPANCGGANFKGDP